MIFANLIGIFPGDTSKCVMMLHNILPYLFQIMGTPLKSWHCLINYFLMGFSQFNTIASSDSYSVVLPKFSKSTLASFFDVLNSSTSSITVIQIFCFLPEGHKCFVGIQNGKDFADCFQIILSILSQGMTLHLVSSLTIGMPQII